MTARSEKLRSKGWTEEGHRLIEEARAKGVCAQCGKRLRSKYPVGDPRRRVFCWNQGNYPDRCSDIFYRLHYQSWNATKYRVLARVRGANGGGIHCERCGRKPKPFRRDVHRSWSDLGWTEEHCGYEFDHILEISAGGDPLDPSNVQLLCYQCHRRKTVSFMRRGTPSLPSPIDHVLEDFL
jgi:5-methylcytosine-specific restriction endonuclease McrA